MSNHIAVQTRGQKIGQLAALFALMLFGFVLVVDGIFLWAFGEDFFSTGNLTFITALVMTIGACSLYQFHRLSGSGARVARALGGHPVALESEVEQEKILGDIATEVAVAAGIKMPKLFVLEGDDQINAFAAGSSKHGTAIAVTQGALDKLSRSELQGLVAHEMAHLRHQDVAQTRWLAAGIFGLLCFAMLGGGVLLLASKVSDSASKEGGAAGLVISLVGLAITALGLIGWLAAVILEAATSRQMEYRADADAVRMVSDSAGLVGVLVKIGQESNEFPNSFQSMLDTTNPMFFRSGAKGFWFNSHPPLLDRIRVLDPAKAAELQAMMDE